MQSCKKEEENMSCFASIHFPFFYMNKFVAAGMTAALSMSFALPAFAEDGAVSSSSVSSSETMSSSTSSAMSSSEGRMMKVKEKMNRGTNSSKPAVDTACVQTAVAKREAALATAVDAYYTSMKSAMSTRAAALATAWGQADATTREAAIRAAHTAFRTSAKTATSTMRTARKASWQTFKTDAKACKVSLPKAESEAEKTDAAM